MTNNLPDKMSDLIELALMDLEAVENNPQYSVNMGFWHEPRFDTGMGVFCAVCFAGAVMANTLKADVNMDAFPGRFDKETETKLLSLDDLRRGEVWNAVDDWKTRGLLPRDTVLPSEIQYFDIARYSDNPVDFKQDMANMALALREHGF